MAWLDREIEDSWPSALRTWERSASVCRHHIIPISRFLWSSFELFDPSIHEVLSQMESNDHKENTVIEEYSKGYRMNGRVLLPSRVVTSKKSPNEKPNDKDSDNASTEAETPA